MNLNTRLLLVIMNHILQYFELVGNALGKGFAEVVYQEAICVLLRENGLDYTKEETIPITFNNHYVGTVRADIILHDTIIECKAIDANLKIGHVPQLLSYMKLKNVNLGVLVNFNQNPCKDMVEVVIVRKHNDFYQADLLDGTTVTLTSTGSVKL